MPKVSILLTCYNHIRFLPDCLASILGQTFKDFEIIAIDDGSSDGTRDWLMTRPEPMKVILNEKNLGTYGSLNRAIQEAEGEFVAVLNDDDLWAPTKLAKQLELFASHPNVGLVHTDGGFIDGDGNPISGSPLGFEFPRTETGDVLLSLLYQNKIIASAVLVRRKCFEKLGQFNPAYFGSGDWEMWLRIAEEFEVGFVAEPLTLYRVHGANASHKLDRIWKDDEKLREWIRTRESVYRAKDYDEVVLRAALSHNEACLGTVKVLNGSPEEGRKAYRRSLALRPSRFKSYVRLMASYLPRPLFRRLV